MDCPKLTFDPAQGFWLDTDRKRWVRNIFDEKNPVYVHIDQSVWTLDVGGIREPASIDWERIHLPVQTISEFQRAISQKLTRMSPVALGQYKVMFAQVTNAYIQGAIFGNFLSDLDQLEVLWTEWLSPSNRSYFRSLYETLVHGGSPGTDYNILCRLASWKARLNVQPLQAVLEWDPETGALTTSELEVLRKEIYRPEDCSEASTRQHFAKIAIWSYLATLRRTIQVMSVPSDGLKRVRSPDGREEAFLAIPGAKAQVNNEITWERIPLGLAAEIEAYRARPEIARLIGKVPYLLFLATKDGKKAAMSSSIIHALIEPWVNRRQLISPRTKELMKLSMLRLRHTGATQLAIQGQPRSVIQKVLQHDSPFSTQVYIDSVGADSLPIMEHMDRRLGGRFSMMKAAFFKGKIVSKGQTTSPPVLLPNRHTPAIVGACASTKGCQFHPLLSCYSCIHFLAFKEADHVKVLDFVETEAATWSSAERGTTRTKGPKDFDRIAAGVNEVIDQIATLQSTERTEEVERE